MGDKRLEAAAALTIFKFKRPVKSSESYEQRMKTLQQEKEMKQQCLEKDVEMEGSERFKDCLAWALNLEKDRSADPQSTNSSCPQDPSSKPAEGCAVLRLRDVHTIMNPSPISASTESGNNSSQANSIKMGVPGAATGLGGHRRQRISLPFIEYANPPKTKQQPTASKQDRSLFSILQKN